MKIYIVVTDVVNDVTYSRKSVITRVHNKGNWIFSCLEKNHGSFDNSSLMYNIKNKLNEYYISFWENSLKSENGKLPTYKLFKTTFGMETYLDAINDKGTIKHLSSFRISAHRLQIERGRYTRPRTRVEDRLCAVCNKIEDEFHFMFECEKYRVYRNNLFEVFKESNINLSDCNRENLVIVWQTTNIKILKAIGNYLQQCQVT